jgi:hypothetical protein
VSLPRKRKRMTTDRILEGVPILRTLTILLAFAALTVTGVGCQVFQEHGTPALRAGPWPQGPDDFGGLKFDATRAETEKKIKLENCQILEVPAAVKKAAGGKMNLPLECKASLNVAGKPFIANVQFAVPHDGESRLINIYGTFARADYPSLKIAFIRLYGQPHRIDTLAGEESLFWGGNKAQIHLGVFLNGGNFGFSPGRAVTRLTIEELPVESR